MDRFPPALTEALIHLAAVEFGRRGGSATSKRKAKAVRENGKKGGRPRKKREGAEKPE